MLPAHIIVSGKNTISQLQTSRDRFRDPFREKWIHSLKLFYIRRLIWSLRRPKSVILFLILLFSSTIYALQSGKIQINFFAGEPFPVFYANLKMQEGTPIDYTLEKLQQLEEKIKQQFKREDYREIASYAGVYFTQTEPLFGEHYGQIMISLPDTMKLPLAEMHQRVRDQFNTLAGVEEFSLLQLEDGPPVTRAISIKVQGTEFAQIQAAVSDLKAALQAMPDVENVTIIDSAGSMELALRLNQDAVHRAGLSAAQIMRDIRILTEGEIITTIQHRGEEVAIRVKAMQSGTNIENWLHTPIAFYDSKADKVLSIPLSELVDVDYSLSRSEIRHHNLLRVVPLEADIKEGGRNTLEINHLIQQQWQQLKLKHPGVSLDFSGELDDIQESLDAMPYLFLMGVGLIYLIIGTQFRSYFQPLLILATIPLAFTGVAAGLFITSNPLSIYTLYGIVALVGIAVNASIVLISAANSRIKKGMSVNHAIIFAARRRMIPILITSLTTIAGLFSLASGFAGKSLIWGPLATAIVWGLAFSSLLTLFVIPLFYRLFIKDSKIE